VKKLLKGVLCFLPTIGIVTPDGFTTGHPRARPWCSERDSFSFLHNSQGWRLLSSSHKNLETGFLYSKQGVCTSTSSVTHQPHLSSCSQNLPMASYNKIELTTQLFPLNSRVKVCYPSLLERVFSLLCYLARSIYVPELPPSFPSSERLCGSKSQFVVGPRSLTDGYPAPSPH
jgi:hypothetical protein